MSDTPAVPPPVMIAVYNQKGGVGKTTTACNLATCLVAFGYRVLLVDLDPQGNATTALGIAPLPEAGTFEVINGRAQVGDIALDTPYEGLWLLPATASLRDPEHLLTPASRRRGLLEARLAGTGVDVVVVDCPPALTAATNTALASAQAVLIPARPDPYAQEGIVNTWHEVQRCHEGINFQLGIVGIVLTQSDADPTAGSVAAGLRDGFAERVLPSDIPADPRVSEAAALGIPVVVFDPASPAARGYLEVTREVLGRLAQPGRVPAPLPAPLDTAEAAERLAAWHAALPAQRRPRAPATRPTARRGDTPAAAATPIERLGMWTGLALLAAFALGIATDWAVGVLLR